MNRDSYDYSQDIESSLEDALETANKARGRRGDPTPEVEMNFAEDLAQRCQELLGIDGLAERIRTLEEEGYDRETLTLELAKQFAAGEIGSGETEAEKIEEAVRTAVAILTEAVVAAPIEGIDGVDVEANDDGTNYIRIHYAGPIRSAGGTAQALSVLVADYIRQEFGLSKFKPRDDEVERYIEEIRIYENEKSLQYSPSDEEIRTIIRHLPILVDAEQVSEREVGGYRDLERIEGNRARGGMCLVVSEGVGLKAAKLQKYTDQLDLDGWDWLDELPNSAGGASGEESGSDDETEDEQPSKKEFKPKKKYIKDLTAGRPIFSHPQEKGGFRLRYGRARNTGLAASGIHPATMWLVGQFIATGTQLKTERPGKAQGASPVSGIEGPTVRLHNGQVKRIDTLEEAKELEEQVDKIIDLGEMAVPFGEFLENNHDLPQASYVHDWWAKEADQNGLSVSGLTPDRLNVMQAVNMSKKYGVPLHPKYTYLWNDISLPEYDELATAVENATETTDGELEVSPRVNTTLENLLIPHTQNDEHTRIDSEASTILTYCLDSTATGETPLAKVNDTAPFRVRKRAPMRIGARMARPEKAKQREQRPAINGLFPVGEEGGNQRDILTAAQHTDGGNNRLDGGKAKQGLGEGVIQTNLAQRRCPQCRTVTYKVNCPECDDVRTSQYAVCDRCGTTTEMTGGGECPECGETIQSYSEGPLNIKEEIQAALDTLDERKNHFEVIKGVKGLFSNTKIVEPPEKAILRAKHDLSIYDDGTIRYDMSDLPLTAFKPDEVSATVEQLKELGYTHDMDGNPLTDGDQTIELRMQDMIINEDAGETLLDIANFIDELLVKYYDMEPYYNADSKEDLIGELLIGLAPHTSAGVVGRLIGFTKASVGYAHPFFHAAKRRNCDGDEDSIMLLMDGLVNYSEKYLNHDRRGWSMDRPLVMSTHIDPGEIDDEAHNVETVRDFSLDFYEATVKNLHPKEILEEVEIGEDHIEDTEISGFHHSIETDSIDSGPANSAYKTLGDMDEKVGEQLRVARLIRASSADDVAMRVVSSHFIPDMMGCLSAFGRQEVRCSKCNTKHRRPPLKDGCRNCGANSLMLNVSEGTVTKYRPLALELVQKYDFDPYLAQRVEEIDIKMDSLFQDDQEKQSDLSSFM